MAKRKKGLVKSLYPIFMIIFLCSVFMYISTSYNTYSNLKIQLDSIEQEIKKQETRQMELKNDLELYKSDAYIEKIAKDKLNYTKSNEILFTID